MTMKLKNILGLGLVLVMLFGIFQNFLQVDKYKGVVMHDGSVSVPAVLGQENDISFPIWKLYNQDLPQYQDDYLTSDMNDILLNLYLSLPNQVGSVVEMGEIDVISGLQILQDGYDVTIFYKGGISGELPMDFAYQNTLDKQALFYHAQNENSLVLPYETKQAVSDIEAMHQVYCDGEYIYDNPFIFITDLFDEINNSNFFKNFPMDYIDLSVFTLDYYTAIYGNELLLFFQSKELEVEYMLFYDMSNRCFTGFYLQQ